MSSNAISMSERRLGSGMPGVVECQECTGSKQMAVNSCLTCLISFCEIHVQSHKENEAFKGHRLVAPDVNLPQKICSKHHMLMEVFCGTDRESICYKCVCLEHKTHEILTPEAGRSEKQEEVPETMQEIQKRMKMNEEKVKEIKTALSEFKTIVEEKNKEYEETFDFLFQSIARKKKEVIKSITEYEQREEEKVKDLIKKLEKETDELKMRGTELEKLTKTDDHIHFLQTFPAFRASLGERNTEDTAININLFQDQLINNLNYLKKLLDKLSNFKFEETTDPGSSHILENLHQPTAMKELKIAERNGVPDSEEKDVIKHDYEGAGPLRKYPNVQVIGGENTFGAREEFLRRLDEMKSIRYQTFSDTKSKLVLLFCSVVSRLGKDISHALRQISAGTKIILVIMHHTPDPRLILVDSSKFVEEKDVLLTVDCLFHEQRGFHNSSLNQEALKKVFNVILKN
ncbi:tripartite motif-containing protein 16-like [Erpetoichthys calabaricus]|uniref:tripartite motif-containing protein 16-like n=1 Tax=Erpetoichthys calabaricus TaxID=27687 RepID=UPI002234E273|nr:tripartite motif-containing protein 16-like [Erpetoichthys calabaricus]